MFEIKKFNNRNLPISVFFTDRKKISNLEATIKHLPKNSAIIIREYDLNKNEREIYAKKIIKIAKDLGFKILIGKDFELAKKLKADGVHFSDFDKLPIKIFKQINFTRNFIFSFSCHSLKSILKAKKKGFNMIFISPIFKTNSHINAKTIGLRNLAKITLKTKNSAYCQVPIYALGGINYQNISAIRKLNLSGFGAINLFLRNEN